MSPQPPDFGNDDSQRIATARRDIPSDPAKAIEELATRAAAHELADARRFRTAAWAFGLLVAGLLTYAGVAWAQHGDDSADRARLEDVQARLVRIEDRLDRLVERNP